MAKKINPTPVVEATAGVNTEVQAAEAVSTEATADVSTEVESAEVVSTEAVSTEAVSTEVEGAEVLSTEVESAEVVSTEAVSAAADLEATEQSYEVQLIPEGIFVAENGDSFEFAVGQFTFQGKVYTKEEALSDHTDVLEHLISVKSFILKKV